MITVLYASAVPSSFFFLAISLSASAALRNLRLYSKYSCVVSTCQVSARLSAAKILSVFCNQCVIFPHQALQDLLGMVQLDLHESL